MIKKLLLTAFVVGFAFSAIYACDEMKKKEGKKSSTQTKLEQGKTGSKKNAPSDTSKNGESKSTQVKEENSKS